MDKLLKSEKLCYKQKTRITKSLYQAFYLLNTAYVRHGYVLKITGSTLNVYTITIFENEITCDCPDSDFSNMNNLYCKHVCFVICYIAKIYNEDLFITRKFSSKELRQLNNRLLFGIDDSDIANSMLTRRFEYINSNIIFDKNFDEKNARNLEDDCLICFTSLSNTEDKICKCPTCFNAIHLKCAVRWLKYHETCIYCKDDIWKYFIDDKLKCNGYLNIERDIEIF